jgi:hypothetical protein
MSDVDELGNASDQLYKTIADAVQDYQRVLYLMYSA